MKSATVEPGTGPVSRRRRDPTKASNRRPGAGSFKVLMVVDGTQHGTLPDGRYLPLAGRCRSFAFDGVPDHLQVAHRLRRKTAAHDPLSYELTPPARFTEDYRSIVFS